MSLALLLLVSLSLLQGCIAPAVSGVAVNPTALFLDTTSPLASSNSTSDVCNNLNNCRSLVNMGIHLGLSFAPALAQNVDRERIESSARAEHSFSNACFLVYDYILTFDSEVTLIWGEPWKSLKVLFLLSRYLPFADTVVLFLYHSASSQSECRALKFGLIMLSAIGICITEYIFAVRTWAMWGFDRNVGIVLVITCLACWLPNVVVALFFGRGTKYFPPTPLVQGCNEASANSPLFLAVSGMLIVYWLVLIGLMVVKGGSPCVVILNMIATTWPHERVNLLFYFQRVMHSVLTNHLLFHIRRYGRKTVRWDLHEVTGGTRPPVGSLVFEHELETRVAGERTRNATNT
ncbi:hypothetical protein FIBSPDRAFT_892990 [Athelia psychrophila]|uniref:DUF6533 domain-containing protein n=1 Tax=Athelia psychrophila TaxID=1759441 RepID=A0A166HTA7_9AGAM|nr:hypothetical protein FIBSPDRAFT_892990 [Fibularhizoctonia sp. CBS 109695]